MSDLVELLDRLQLERAHVMGISLGGVIAQRLAVDHPSRVDRLVLVSCADRFTPYLRQVASLLGHSLRRFPKEAFVRTMELLGTSPQYLDENEAIVEQRVAAKCASRVSGRAWRNSSGACRAARSTRGTTGSWPKPWSWPASTMR